MKKTLIRIILNCALLIPNSFCFAQNKKIDSLLTLLKTDRPDTNKVNHLCQLMREFELTGNFDKALNHGTDALQLSLKLNFKKGIANASNNIGNNYLNQGKYTEALKKYFVALNIREEIGDKKGVAASLGNIGIVYQCQGNFPKALKNQFSSIKIWEEIKDKQGLANAYNNIGLIYEAIGNYPEALKFYFNALKINEEIKNKPRIANALLNIGLIYQSQSNYAEALKNFLSSLQIFEEIGDKHGISISYSNIGNNYESRDNYTEALKNHFFALKIEEEIGDKSGIATSYDNIANSYGFQGNYQESLKNHLASLKIMEEINNKQGISRSFLNLGTVEIKLNKLGEAQNYLNKSLKLSKEIRYNEAIKETYSSLAALDSIKGNWKAAYQHNKLFIVYRDSIDNEQTKKKTIESALTYKFETQEAATKAEQDKKDAVQQSEAKREKVIRYSVIAGLVLMFLVSFIIFRSLRITRRQKKIIELQKEEVSRQKDIAEELRELSENQKHIVEEKQKEIIQSITYAKRIQTALVTSDKYINTHLPAEHFILFKPKDIVSGDFYWALRHLSPTLSTGEGDSPHANTLSLVGRAGEGCLFYLITADCTGHGVPGAFMSMLNISYLNENIVERCIRLPHDILNAQRKEIIQALNPEGSTDESKDGMDCILCAYDFDKMLLHFAAANNPLWLVREKSSEFKVENSELSESNSKLNTQNFELIEYKADKMPVGKYSEKTEPFTLNTIELQKGDIIYTSTDGFADQFGSNGKKLMKKKFKEELLKIHLKPMAEQKEHLNKFFENWKGSNEQVDDVCVIGVRI